MTRAGLAPATANQNLGGFKINQVGAGAAPTDAATVAQVGLQFPTGFMAPYAGTSAPFGYLVCDGSAVSRAIYANLFNIIGTVWGAGDGSTTFNVPNLTGRVPAGLDLAGSTLSFATAVGAAGGQQNHVLTSGEMPAHNHPAAVTDPGHNHTSLTPSQTTVTSFTAATNVFIPPGVTANTSTSTTGITVSTSNTGGGAAHTSVQPTAVVLWCIRV